MLHAKNEYLFFGDLFFLCMPWQPNRIAHKMVSTSQLMWSTVAAAAVTILLIRTRRRRRQAAASKPDDTGRDPVGAVVKIEAAANSRFRALPSVFYPPSVAVVPIVDQRERGQLDGTQAFLVVIDRHGQPAAAFNATDLAAFVGACPVLALGEGDGTPTPAIGAFSRCFRKAQTRLGLCEAKTGPFVVALAVTGASASAVDRDFEAIAPTVTLVAPPAPAAADGKAADATPEAPQGVLTLDVPALGVRVTVPGTWRLAKLAAGGATFVMPSGVEKVVGAAEAKLLSAANAGASVAASLEGQAASEALHATWALDASVRVGLAPLKAAVASHKSQPASAVYHNGKFGVRFGVVAGAVVDEPTLAPTSTVQYRPDAATADAPVLTLQKWADAPEALANTNDEEGFVHAVTMLFASYDQVGATRLASKVEPSRFAGLRCGVFDEATDDGAVTCRTFVVPMPKQTALVVRWEAPTQGFAKSVIALAKFLDKLVLLG